MLIKIGKVIGLFQKNENSNKGVRRFFLLRTGTLGRIHFLDGTPTESVFELGQDDPRITHWLGMNTLPDGETQWFDLAAVQVEGPSVQRHRMHAVEA